MSKTQMMQFGSTDLNELWKSINNWLQELQKDGRIEVTGTLSFTNTEIFTKGPQFTAIIFYVKFSK